ncbi:hypothetical protein [Devosia sp. Root105]|uniref:hypothetical protein n=1 Tax=Devosia sp. Root105 TaxID=1736423 RepID=UPI0006F7F0CE|nr:hypothetical protein [Devosia sp. Root105]KQU95206.1 hypothetical protein ASC68_18820 [Devosia sp. Root105]
MKFFLPAAESPEQAEDIYGKVKSFVVEQSGPVRDVRYYAIYYRHNSRDLVATVGEPEPLTGETVVAIFKTQNDSGPFLVCTLNRGVARGAPILASNDARAIEFKH